MTFVSYAQNFEDVMLWRALKHVKEGFYIDVGANDPTIDSVTRAFYERDWRGINIEPMTSHHKDLQAQRPRDINLCCAAGETSGEIDLFDCAVSGWATADQSVADQHVLEGRTTVCHRVPLRTLSEICQEYVLGEIHFLKIDVEGLEKQVVVGADFQKYRPWIVVVEATKPNSTEEVFEQWECLLLAAGYQFAYADGLNRFYAASERADLLPALKYPPNVFDDFALNVQRRAEAQAAAAEAAAQQAEAQNQQAELKAQQAEVRTRQAEASAQQAEAKSQQTEAAAKQIELRAQQTEARAQQTEIRAQQTEIRAQQTEIRAQHTELRLQRAETTAQQAEARAQQAESQAQQADARAKQTEVKSEWAKAWAQQAEAARQQAEARARQAESQVRQAESVRQQAETRAQQAEAVLNAVYNSRSWRITAIPRWCSRQTQLMRQYGLLQRLKALVKKIVRNLARRGDAFFSVRPRLRRRCVALIWRVGLYNPLRSFYHRCLGQQRIESVSSVEGQSIVPCLPADQLTPRTRQIYAQLVAAIQHRQQETH